MLDVMEPDVAQDIVGMQRSPVYHYGRAAVGTMYILHSTACLEADRITECPYTRAMVSGNMADGLESDTPVRLSVNEGQLRPAL